MRCFQMDVNNKTNTYIIDGESVRIVDQNISWDQTLESMISASGRSWLQARSEETNIVITDQTVRNAKCVIGSEGIVWGAGLNYKTHSNDLDTLQPNSAPGSYLRPRNSLINNGEPIVIPSQSSRVTGEAEIGIVIGKSIKNQPLDKWTGNVAGLTTVLDMTAEDVIRENPRHIPWAKGFDSFCSLGPVVVSLDEFTSDSLEQLLVETRTDDGSIRTGVSSSMKYGMPFLVNYFSQGRTIPAGSVICTGTPGALALEDGMTVSASVSNVGRLTHPVVKG